MRNIPPPAGTVIILLDGIVDLLIYIKVECASMAAGLAAFWALSGAAMFHGRRSPTRLMGGRRCGRRRRGDRLLGSTPLSLAVSIRE